MLALWFRAGILAVLGFSLTAAMVGVTVASPPQQRPANDDFGSRQVLNGSCSSVTGSNTTATRQDWENYTYAGSPANHSVWYHWDAPANGSVTFETTGSSFDTVLAVYTWPSSNEPLKLQASNDDAPNVRTSLVQFSASSGTRYYIVVDGNRGDTGTIKLSWAMASCTPDTGNPAPSDNSIASADDVGQQSGVPDVSDQFGGGSPLTLLVTLKAGTSSNSGWTYQIPAKLRISLSGFKSGLVNIQLVRPDGTVRPAQPDQVRIGFGNEEWIYVIPLTDRPGTYTVRAAQGTVRGSITFRLSAPSSPNIVVDPSAAQSGATFTAYLAGFPANSRVLIHLSRRTGKCPSSGSLGSNRTCYRYAYVRSYSIRTDSRGQATSLLRLAGQTGTYQLKAVHSGGAEASDYIDLGVSEREIPNPTIGRVRLDWCYATGTLCGWNAAFEFCKLAGYATAVDFQFDSNVGQRGISTKVLGTGFVCTAAHCDAFKRISCQGFALNPQQQTFLYPTVGLVRLDWCYQPGAQCGSPAANAWCVTQGFTRAIDFEPEANVGQRNEPTKVLGTGTICTTSGCDSFKTITCLK